MSFCILSNYQTEYKQKRLLILEKKFKNSLLFLKLDCKMGKEDIVKVIHSLEFAISMLLYVGLLLTINHYRLEIDIL